jgi:hypothetical protein
MARNLPALRSAFGSIKELAGATELGSAGVVVSFLLTGLTT